MVRIKMLRNKPGSPNGYQVNHYEEGQEYDVPETLAKIFVEEDRVAEIVPEVDADAEAAKAAKAAKAAEDERIKAEKAAEKAAKAEEAERLKIEKEAEKAAKAEAAAKEKAEKAAAKALLSAPENKAEKVAKNKAE